MNRIARSFVCLLVVVLAVCVVTTVPMMAAGGTDWEQFHKDAANTGNATSTVSANNTISWFTDDIGAVDSSSVVVGDGHVFVYCNNNIKSLSESTGEVVWTYDNITAPTWGSWSSPAYHNGNVFIASGTKVYSISDNGTLNWTYTMPSEALNGSVTIAEGKVFVGDWAGHHYYSLSETDGSFIWSFTVSGYAQGTPAYDSGKVYFTSWVYGGNGHVYGVNTDNGTEIWHQTFPLAVAGSAAVNNNVVYVATYNFGGEGKLYALNTDSGSILWESIAIQSTDSTPAVADGKVYVSGGCPGYWDLATYSFYTDNGTQVWKRDNIGGWTSSMAVADNAVLVGNVKDPWTGGSYGTYALNPDTGATIWSSSYGGSSPAVANGRVFTISQGRVFAFGMPAAEFAELVPTQIGLPTSINDGQANIITAVVKNNGTGTATSIKVTLKANDTLIETETIATLTAGAEATANFTDWAPTIGDYTLKVTVDPDNAIKEPNDENNELTKSVSVPQMKLNLVNGWNFISTPKKLKASRNTAQQVFGEVNTDNHSIFVCAAPTGWQALATDNVVAPLDGIWIYSNGSCEVYFVFDTDPLRVPPTKQLYAGWSAIGFSALTETSANSALTSVEAQWAYLLGFNASTQKYEDSIINNTTSGDHAESRLMYPGRGYWLYMTADGELAAIGM